MPDGIEATDIDTQEFLNEATMENQRLRAHNVVLELQVALLKNVLPMTDNQCKQYMNGIIEIAERLK